MYELTVERSFCAAHFLRDYEGACARMHGHNYRVEVCVAGEQLQANGMLLDFGRLKELCDAILGELDHRLLNELPPFSARNATSENLARYIHDHVRQALTGTCATVRSVRVWETPGQSATYTEASP